MGFEDRQYVRDDSSFGYGRTGLSRYSIVVILIVINAVIWLLDQFAGHMITEWLCLSARQPWRIWTLLTYGFLHSPGPLHILFNMYVLFMFGRPVAGRLGRHEFLRFYLVAIVFSGLAFLIWHLLARTPGAAVGASGATTAVLILFILWYPHQKLSIFVAEIPAWVLGVAIIGYDVLRAFTGDSGVAWQAHLAGAGFAWLYLNYEWNFRWMSSFSGWIPKPKNKNLSVYDPDSRPSKDDKLREEGDRILAKISEQGEEGLSRKERKTLERYSKMLREQK
jgi:membrane associated rhomboid family serine protease